MGTTVCRNPRAPSSALAALGSLQPGALGFLQTVVPLVSVSNYYIVFEISKVEGHILLIFTFISLSLSFYIQCHRSIE